ncbi:MAG: hypothetical protein MI924_02080 [Chloroflexales bacterium]|nr:hypothetical protein [Chloroflexales bacterium]
MQVIAMIWRMQLTAAQNTLLYDARTRIGWVLALLVGCMLSLGSARWLHAQLPEWRLAGDAIFQARLWLLLIGGWLVVGGLTAIVTLRDELGGNAATLLMTMPLDDSARFRALCGKLLLEQLALICLSALPLALALDWAEWAWVLLDLAGKVAATFSSVVGTLLVVRLLTSFRQMIKRFAQAALIGVFLGLLVRFAGLLDSPWPAPSPLALALLAGLWSGMIIGPLAEPLGKLYTVAFYALQAQPRPHRAITPPGVRWLAGVLSRRRGVTAALLSKDLLARSRDLFSWALFVVLLYLAPFPWVYDKVAAYGITEPLFMAAYVIGLVLFTILDGAPSPFGGEGNRLALLLLAPVDGAVILRAKFSGFVTLLLFEGLALSLILGLWQGITPVDMLFVSVVAALAIVGVTGLITWGSAWDIDLNLPIEGATQALIYERVPSTLCRIALMLLSFILAAALLIVLWRLPPLPGLVVVTGGVALVLLVSWRIGRAGLYQALRV